MVPLMVSGILWISGKKWYASFWLPPVAALLVAANLEIFIWPPSSTSALLGLFAPLWCLLIVGPLALLVGWGARKAIDKIYYG